MTGRIGVLRVKSIRDPLSTGFDQTTLGISKHAGKLYALPRTNYTMGLVINTKLFTQAGLDPTKPPQTWADVASDAKQISARVGNGVAGYADYSAGNNGGWHFTAELYSLGGDMVTADGKKAAFDNAKGRQVLQTLHDIEHGGNEAAEMGRLISDAIIRRHLETRYLGVAQP